VQLGYGQAKGLVQTLGIGQLSKSQVSVMRHLPSRCRHHPLVGAVLAEQQDEWLVASPRYLSAGSLKAVQAPITEQREVVPELAAAADIGG
jgi:hypothetical protein